MAGNLSPKLPWELANPRWAGILNPVLANPIVSGQLLESQVLLTGDNTINHGLGRKLQGYFIAIRNTASTIYDKQLINPRPQLTLVLHASVPVIVTIYVF